MEKRLIIPEVVACFSRARSPRCDLQVVRGVILDWLPPGGALQGSPKEAHTTISSQTVLAIILKTILFQALQTDVLFESVI